MKVLFSICLGLQTFFGVYSDVRGMLSGTRYFGKSQSKEEIWKIAWEREDQDWGYRLTKNLRNTIENVHILIWWQLSYNFLELMY